MEKQSPVRRIWELGKSEHAHLMTVVLLAVIGVICGMVPYFAAARIIILLLSGEQALSAYGVWLGAALVDTLAQVNTTVARWMESSRPRSRCILTPRSALKTMILRSRMCALAITTIRRFSTA